MLDITVMIKDSGCKSVKITPKMLGDLAKSIVEKGSEYVSLATGTLEVVGLMVTGKQTGDRVIMLGPKANGTTE
jgi:hypothetical protein